VDLTPRRVRAKAGKKRLRAFVRALAKLENRTEEAIEAVRAAHVHALTEVRIRDRIGAEAAMNVLADLAKMGWTLSVRRTGVSGCAPSVGAKDDIRTTRRAQLAARRHEQLRLPSTQEFITRMEAGHLFKGQLRSVFNLMRDGRDLANALSNYRASKDASAPARPFVQPYLQFVDARKVCSRTGFRLQDIWRYFRHTWASAYESVPGRSLMVLVRDASTPFHPVMGIAALASAASVLPARDRGFIKWTGEAFSEDCGQRPDAKTARWVKSMIRGAIKEIYRTDFIAEGLVPLRVAQADVREIVKRLRKDSAAARERHVRQAEIAAEKSASARAHGEDDWEEQARTDLFRSKRAWELASLLELQAFVERSYQKKRGRKQLQSLLETKHGRDVLSKVVRIARSKTIGTAIADLVVCGSVAPYNEILGGKLIAMLAASPEVVRQYKLRYGGVPSVIASSMAGRRVIRSASLVYIGTTSLYGTRPSQYDRIAVPAEQLGGKPGESVRYRYLGDTAGLGTTQFGYATKKSVEAFTRRTLNGVRRVNNVFGEGANPKLRALRDGIAQLGFSEDLMVHGLTKSVYGVSLVKNLRGYLLGIDKRPQYMFPLVVAGNRIEKIVDWWYQRWVADRCGRQDIIERVQRHTLVRPVVHGARVSVPVVDAA